MPGTATQKKSAPRPRDSEATRQAILEAATKAFCEIGYDGAGTRDIARAAGVDPRLITRYYGSKEGLFARVVEETNRKGRLMTPGNNREIAIALLTDDPAVVDGFLLTLRSAANPQAAEILRTQLEDNYQRQLADALDGEDAGARAVLLISICAGVQLMRAVLRNSQLRETDIDRLVPYLQGALDLIAEPGPVKPAER